MQSGRCLNEFCAQIFAGAVLSCSQNVEGAWNFYADGLPLCGISGATFGFKSAANGYDWIQQAMGRRAVGAQNADAIGRYVERLEIARLKANGAGNVGLAEMLQAEMLAMLELDGDGLTVDGGTAQQARRILVDGGSARY